MKSGKLFRRAPALLNLSRMFPEYLFNHRGVARLGPVIFQHTPPGLVVEQKPACIDHTHWKGLTGIYGPSDDGRGCGRQILQSYSGSGW